jgi:[NiFe] hydrogenase assembly HybE family chaperone
VNLVLVRGAVEAWKHAPEGEPVVHAFSCGNLVFLGASEPEVGDFATCALTTAMHQFASQDGVREFALAALDALRRPAPPTPCERPAAAPAPRAEPPMSKRRFLQALIPGAK